MTGPDGGLQIVRRDLAVRIRPGLGFSTHDRARLPGVGVYRFSARALHRDGSAVARWNDPGTTEIVGVCNRTICELITPDQQQAGLAFTGPSSIHLESDFFSETPPTVWLEYGSWTFNITDLCEITQTPSGPSNHVAVRFNSMDLPIGPRTWARYTIELHPMPVVPPGAKLRDSIWVLTNGAE
jgi:hypothetical protein